MSSTADTVSPAPAPSAPPAPVFPASMTSPEVAEADKLAATPTPSVPHSVSRGALQMSRLMRPCKPVALAWEDVAMEVAETKKAKTAATTAAAASAERLQVDNTIRSREGHKLILSSISGNVVPGEFVAIMGASGAGKTTLLNVLSRRNTANLGQIRVNGRPVDRSFRRISAFVQQEDLFLGTLTVREHLRYIAMLRMNQDLSQTEVDERVDQLIDALDLTKVAHSLIGGVGMGLRRGISGGERKRLAFASEIITDPSLLFADEPTSGLDSYMAQNVVSMMQMLARNGRTVLATIHQPSSEVYAMFDKLMLLAEGRLVYYGPREEAIEYFRTLGPAYDCPGRFNPADFWIMKLAEAKTIPGEIDRLAKHWESSPMRAANLARLQGGVVRWRGTTELGTSRRRVLPATDAAAAGRGAGGAIDAPAAIGDRSSDQEASSPSPSPLPTSPSPADAGGASSDTEDEWAASLRSPEEEAVASNDWCGTAHYRASWWKQLWVLTQRSLIATLRNPMLSKVRFFQATVMSTIVGLIYLRLDNGQASVQDKTGGLFGIVINQSMTTVFGVLQTFPTERPIFLREHEAGTYRVDTYYLAKTISDIPFQLIFPTLFVTIAYWMTGFNDEAWRYGAFLGVVLLVSNVAMSLGYFVSCLVPSVEIALGVGPVAILPFLLFGGFFLNTASIPKYFIWLEYLSWFKYGFSALSNIIWSGVTLDCPASGRCFFPAGEDVLKFLSLREDDLGRDIGALVALLVGWRILAFLALYRGARRKQNA